MSWVTAVSNDVGDKHAERPGRRLTPAYLTAGPRRCRAPARSNASSSATRASAAWRAAASCARRVSTSRRDCCSRRGGWTTGAMANKTTPAIRSLTNMEYLARSAASCSPVAGGLTLGVHRCSTRPRAVQRLALAAPPRYGWRRHTARTPAPTPPAGARTGPAPPSAGETQARTVDVSSASLPHPSASLSIVSTKAGQLQAASRSFENTRWKYLSCGWLTAVSDAPPSGCCAARSSAMRPGGERIRAASSVSAQIAGRALAALAAISIPVTPVVSVPALPHGNNHPCRRPGLRTPMGSVNGAGLRCQHRSSGQQIDRRPPQLARSTR